MKNFNNFQQQQQQMYMHGMGGGYQGAPRQPYMGDPQSINMMMSNNQDLYDEDYYDEEIDEEEAYQQALRMQAGIQPNSVAAQQFLNQSNQIQRAEAMLGEGFEIMEEELDEDYEPTQDEIEEYAKYLGMDIADDRDLFYIAKEGLKAPLPDPWKPCKSPNGNIYYFNFSSQELQKEHPCDDYYKKYYAQEKANKRKKKEEQKIKKQIKEQKKKQDKLSTSMNSTSNNQNPTAQSMIAGAVGNTSIHQMALMMNMSGLDMSTSSIVLNEKVQIELEKLMDEYEEQKIQHERKRRDELKKLEQDCTKKKIHVSEEAKSKVDLLKKASSPTKSSLDLQIQRRKTDLQLEKDKRVRELRDQELQKLHQHEHKLDVKLDKRKQDFKQETELRHKLESDNLKALYQQKLQIEKDRVQEENSRLLEESGDIDFQVRLFKEQKLQNEVDQQKYEIEEEFRQKIKEAKQDNKKKIEREDERIRQEMAARLEKEREKEMRKAKLERSKIDDKKETLKREHQVLQRDQKKQIEKDYQEMLRRKKLDLEEDIDMQKIQVKKQVQNTYEQKEDRLSKDQDKARADIREMQERYERQGQTKAEEQKKAIEREFEEQWQREKQEMKMNENEKSETYQAIIKEIQMGKQKVKDLEAKENKQARELKQREKEVDELEMEKRGKERQVKSKLAESSNQAEDDYLLRQLQKEIKDKQDELDRLRLMIKDKQLSNTLKPSINNSSEDFFRLSKDLDQVKTLLLDLKNNPTSQQPYNQPKSYKYTKKQQQQPYFDYTLDEIQAFIELNLPKISHKRKKHDEDRLILRQLIANIERNRMKLRKELMMQLQSDRRVAVQSIKEKIEEQARMMEEEENRSKDKSEYYRRKEEKLRVIKQKIDIIKGLDRFEDELDTDRKDALFKEIQIDYDKFLKLYQDKDNIQRRTKSAIRNQDFQIFQDKWRDYLIDEATDDLVPLIHLDPTHQTPLFKPRSLYQKYELSASKYNSNLAFNHIYDREIEKVKENRFKMRDFLSDQQRWLGQMRAELNVVRGGGVVPSYGGGMGFRTMQHVGSNDTLYQLKNNLSNVLVNY